MKEYKQGWYSVRVDGDETKACVNVEALADALPHGSGIDGDYDIVVRRNGNVDIYSSVHRMDDNGFYCGWADFHVRIYRARDRKVPALKGPCEGQTQVLHEKGDLLFRLTGGRDYGDYLHEAIYFALVDAGIAKFAIA